MNDSTSEPGGASADERLVRLFREVAAGALAPVDAVAHLQREAAMRAFDGVPLEVDLGRASRIGFAEVVYGEGKTPEIVVQAARRLLAVSDRLLVTRANDGQVAALRAAGIEVTWHAPARVITVGLERIPKRGSVAVLCAGTTDVPVAEEAALTAEMWGAAVERHYDVGVAGLHRLLTRIEGLRRARAIVVCAGMEGALPSVVGGLLGAPLIACPTSVGYGAGFRGLTALFAMLNSCAPGVTVVNIDNGFGAGYAAGRINHVIAEAEKLRPESS